MLITETVHMPVWTLFEVPRFGKLNTNCEADVCVVRAGIGIRPKNRGIVRCTARDSRPWAV